MKAHQASLINAVLLITMGLWAYFASESAPKTAFVPVGFGVALVALNFGVKKGSKILSHIAMAITVLVLLSLIMPLVGSINRGNELAVVRVGAMMASAMVAIVFFVKSFGEARRKRESGGTK
jgi:choline-glycine betaine transporter